MTPRSYLYVPGSRPDRFEKALASGADAVVLDLEDGVADADLAHARTAVAAWVTHPRGPVEQWVRIRAVGRRGWEETLRAAVRPGLTGIRAPKVASAAVLRTLDEALAVLEVDAGLSVGGTRVLPVIESAAGLLAAADIARGPRVERLALGQADYLADFSPLAPEDGPLLAHAELTLAVVSAAAGLPPPVAGPCTRLGEADAVRRWCERARRHGFGACTAVHPAHIAVIHAVLRPSPDELDRARALVEGHPTPDAYVGPPGLRRARKLLEGR